MKENNNVNLVQGYFFLCFTLQAPNEQSKDYKSDKNVERECSSPLLLFVSHRGMPKFWWYWQATQSEASAKSGRLSM